MSLSDQKLKGFTKLISSLADQPRMQPQDLKAYFDSSPEEVRQAHNNLCDALCAPDAAASLGFARTAGVPADTVQAAVEHVQAQVSDAVSGNLPSGSVTGDKLAQDVRDRLSAIESAAASEASTRQSTDSSLQSQISSLNLGKSEIMVGTYVGDSQPVRLISLGRKPKAVYLCHSMGLLISGSSRYGGLALDGHPAGPEETPIATIVDQGFQVYFTSGSQYNVMSNFKDTSFYYIAWL